MYSILQSLHSIFAYIVLFVLLIAVINAFAGWYGKKEFTMHKDLRISLYALILSHLQLLIGLVLYFISPLGLKSLQSTPIGEMSSEVRLLALEHMSINILAIVVITIGWSRHKKLLESRRKFRSIALLYGSGLLLILSRIPWSQWFN